MPKRPAELIEGVGKDANNKKRTRSCSPAKSTNTKQKQSAKPNVETKSNNVSEDSKARSKTAKSSRKPSTEHSETSSTSDDEVTDPRRVRNSGLPKLLKNQKPYPVPLDFLTPSLWKLPTKNNRIVNFDPYRIVRDALETNVVLLPRLPHLFTSFLRVKRAHGSNVEKGVYANMGPHDLVVRLIEKRCLHFVNSHDYTVLRDGTNSNLKADGFDAVKWLRVGQSNEYLNQYIKMAEYLTYDEMMLSSLIGSSGPAFLSTPATAKTARKKILSTHSRHAASS